MVRQTAHLQGWHRHGFLNEETPLELSSGNTCSIKHSSSCTHSCYKCKLTVSLQAPQLCIAKVFSWFEFVLKLKRQKRLCTGNHSWRVSSLVSNLGDKDAHCMVIPPWHASSWHAYAGSSPANCLLLLHLLLTSCYNQS